MKKNKMISLVVDEEMYGEIEDLANINYTSMGCIVRRAISMFLEQINGGAEDGNK